jgi:hypothetical protein
VPSTPATGKVARQAAPQGWPAAQRSRVTMPRGLIRLYVDIPEPSEKS